MGRSMVSVLVTPLMLIGEWTAFALLTVLPILKCVIHPRETVRCFYAALVGALPMALVLGITLGAVIWMQTRGVLERTAGATELLPTVLAVAVLLELSPVGAGLIVAARTGAGLGAELASMRVTEQTDALELLGLSPMQELIAPRIAACMLVVPMLHVLTGTTALLSGYAAESIVDDRTWLRYQELLFAELRFMDVLIAGLKTIFFGWLIGVASCRVGMIAPTGSLGVGRAATTAVVLSSLAVLWADVVVIVLSRSFV